MSVPAEQEALAQGIGVAGDALADVGGHGLPLRHHQAGEPVNAEVQKRRAEGDAGAGENGVGVPAQGKQPGQGLVNEAAAGDDDQVAAGQQQLTGGIRVVSSSK